MKWLKRLTVVFVVLIVIAAAFAAWLLGSESGTRFALARAKSALADKLDVAQARGSLVSPLELTGLHYRDKAAGIDVSIKSVKVDYSFSGFFSKTLHVNTLDVDGVDITLTTVTPIAPTAPAPSMQSLLTPPLAILIDRAHIGRIAVSQDGKPVFASDTLDLAGSWTNDTLTIRQLALRAPDGKIDLSGALTSYRDYRGNAKVAFDWKTASERFAGTVDVGGDANLTTMKLALSEPMAATADATTTNSGALSWTLNLSVPRFDPRPLGGSDTLQSVALELKGSGDRTHGKLTGNIDLNAHKVLFDPLQFALDGKTLTLENVHLRSPDATGTLTAKAKVQTDAEPVSGEITLDWDGVELPTDLVGQSLATHGNVHASGNAKKFDARSEFAIGPPGKLADIALELDGTPQVITLHRFDLKQAKGGLNATGAIMLQPQIGWNVEAKATHLDPGAFAKEWPGSIDFALSTNGKMEKDGPAGRLKLDKLSGTLRQRVLSGNADLTFTSPLVVDGALSLKSGNSSIALHGKGGKRADLNIDLAIASLDDWIPKAGGSLTGNISLQGEYPKLDTRGKIDAAKVTIGNLHIDTIDLTVDAHDLTAPSGHLNIVAKSVASGGYVFDTLKLDAHGDQTAHSVNLDAHGAQLDVSLGLNGALAKQKNGDYNWHGTLSALNLAPKDAPPWKLTHAADLKYTNGDFALGELCLGAQASSLCASVNQSAEGATQAKFSITHLALATIATFASPDALLKLDGEINGNGEVGRAANGSLSGHANITSTAGSIAYPDTTAQPLLAYQGFDVAATLAPQQSIIDVHAKLNDGGHLESHVSVGASVAGSMPLSGNVVASLKNLGFIDLITNQTSATKGNLDAKFTLAGTTAAPNITGNLALADFATEVPVAGLKLHDGHIVLHSEDGRSFVIDGSIASGNGKLALSGNIATAADAPISLKINGENFLAADIPGAKVEVSPDLTVTRATGKLTLTGSITIPKAEIDMAKLPGGGVAKTSPDVVVIDAETPTATASTPIEADITVKLGAGDKLAMDLRQGQEVHLVGFGLNGYLGGQIVVQDHSGRPVTGRGQIVVNGTYKAYGQDLKIEQGRLLFAGTPIENPGLDIRATRGFTDPEVTVGMQVRGTAQVPVLTVFSNPAMEQSDALSYLVAGRPLSQLKSGEGDAVGNAARALGTAGGDLLAKSIGSKMGVDDVGVADSTAVGGAALTVGKYLSPRLYLSYGVGLFTPGEVVTVRYRLTRLFNIEMQNGTLSSRAGINYKIEK